MYRSIRSLFNPLFLSSCFFFCATTASHALSLFEAFNREPLALESLHAIQLEERPESEALDWALADFSALWAYRVGFLPQVLIKGEGVMGNLTSIILKKKRSLKGAHSGTFSIQRKGIQIVIKAYDTKGWIDALYTIAHEVLGARWYWPSPLGFEWVGEVPQVWPKTLERVVIEPSFDMRTLYPMNSDYSRRNRLSKGYSFNHNLARIFKPEYQSLAPNMYADLGAKATVVKGSTGYDPQPNFTAPEAIQLATLAAVEHFEKNPSARSFSLSPNDNTLFDSSADTEKVITPIRYFRGRPDYTPLTFAFANSVAEGVFNRAGLWYNDRGEPRYLTMLAYYWTEQSPDFALHPRIVPILTSDRAQWQDASYREEDQALIERWAQSGVERLGAWDYYFGTPYPYPRQFNQWIIESLPYLYDHGVDIFFSQLPAFWGLDGAKAWLSSQLLWSVTTDSETLLDEFYQEFFGEAHGAMRAFYQRAEAHRNQHAGTASWIKYYYDEAGIELFPKLILSELRALISEAEAAVEAGSRYAQRVAIVSEAFAFTEGFAEYHAARKALAEYCLGIQSSGGLEWINRFLEIQDRFLNYASFIIENPLHASAKEFLLLGQTDPSAGAILPILKELNCAEPSLLRRFPEEIAITEAWQMSEAAGDSQLANSELRSEPDKWKRRDFLGPAVPDLADWKIGFRPAEYLTLSPVAADAGLRIGGADMFNIYTFTPVEGEADYLIEAKLAYQVSPDCRAQIRVDWVDASGKKFKQLRLIQLPNGGSGGVRSLHIPLRAPKAATEVKLSFLVFRQAKEDWIELHAFDWLKLLD